MPLFGRSRTIFRVCGFPIKVNLSWLLLLGLIVYTLGSPGGLFDRWLQGAAPPVMCWALGLAGAVGLFASLLVHELCHSIVARHTGIHVRGITLFIFGGVSELEDDPPTPLAEFLMAAAGPLSSALIGSAFLAVTLLGPSVGMPAQVSALVSYLAAVNWALAVFNSVPAFPLDGGRVVRSLLWGLSGDPVWATRWAAGIGSAGGAAMMIGGVMLALTGHGIGAIWLAFVGFFVRQAAAAGLMQMITSHALRGEYVGRFMTPSPVTVTRGLSLRRFVDEYVLPCHYELFPVVDDRGLLVGVARSRDPARVDQARWDEATVADIMQADAEDLTTSPDTAAVTALGRLSAQQDKRLVVVAAGRPVGILSLRDLMSFVALKRDLARGVQSNRGA